MYSAAMTLGVNNGEERLNNLYCMGDDAKINKAEILNWILWSHKYTSSPGSWSVLSHESFRCVWGYKIFFLAKVLLIFWPLAWGWSQTLDGEQDWRLFHADTKLLIQISPDGVKRGHFAQIDHLPYHLQQERLVFKYHFHFPEDVCMPTVCGACRLFLTDDL